MMPTMYQNPATTMLLGATIAAASRGGDNKPIGVEMPVFITVQPMVNAGPFKVRMEEDGGEEIVNIGLIQRIYEYKHSTDSAPLTYLVMSDCDMIVKGKPRDIKRLIDTAKAEAK